MAIILTVGLLTTSTYPAVYAPYVAQTSVLAHSSPGEHDDDLHPALFTFVTAVAA